MKKKSIEFLAVILSTFIAGGVIYGFLGYQNALVTGVHSLTFIAGISGGYFISAIFCGIYLFVKFIKNRNVFLKMILALLLPFTILLTMICGLFMLIPCIIICIIKIVGKSDESETKQRVIKYKEYSEEKGLRFIWEEGFEIKSSTEDEAAVITANEQGLISLANHLVALSQEKVPAGSRLRFDEHNALKEGSKKLVICKSK